MDPSASFDVLEPYGYEWKSFNGSLVVPLGHRLCGTRLWKVGVDTLILEN